MSALSLPETEKALLSLYLRGSEDLLYAAKEGIEDIVEQYAKEDISLNGSDENGYTPLMWATRKGHTRIVQILSDAKADLDKQSSAGNTALHLTAFHGHAAALSILLDAGANPNMPNYRKDTPLLLALPNAQLTKALVQHRADVNYRNDYESTPLKEAAQQGFLDTVDALLQGEASIDLQDDLKDTALTKAASNGHEGVVQKLIEKRANLNIQNNTHHTALTAAAEKQHWGIVRLLAEAEAEVPEPLQERCRPFQLRAHNWRLVAFIVAWLRANRTHPFRFSCLPLAYEVRQLAYNIPPPKDLFTGKGTGQKV